MFTKLGLSLTDSTGMKWTHYKNECHLTAILPNQRQVDDHYALEELLSLFFFFFYRLI